MTDMELLVEMRELAAGVLEKEPAADGERTPEQIHEQHGAEDQNRGAVGVEDRPPCSEP